MQNGLLPKAEQYKAKRRRNKIWRRIVGILACVVVFCTTYALILPAITLEQTAYCGLEEHTHGPQCYETRLICGYDGETEPPALSEAPASGHVHTSECYEERRILTCQLEESSGHVHSDDCFLTDNTIITIDQTLVCAEEHEHTAECYQTTENHICTINEGEGAHTHGPECYETQYVLICGLKETGEVPAAPAENHVHTDACYQKILICEKPEHKHTLACFSNPAADVESREVWERTVAGVELTGIWADDVIAIAETQLGYQESAANYIVMDDGVTIKGYTRYGAWHGDPYGDWSAAFVSFCLNYAEIPETEIPYEVSCNDWTDILSSYEWNLYRGAGGYVPKKGDIVFFDTNGDGSSDHAGIVKEFNAETARIETIEGNSANRVQYGTYTTDDFRICGYGALPEQGNKTYIDPYIDQINPEESVLPADDQINPDNDIIILEDIVLPEQEAEVPYTDATASYEYEDVIILEDIVLPEQENEVPYTDATSSYEYEDISIPEDFILSEQENKDLAEITKIAVIYTDENYLALLNDGTLITLTGAIPEEAEIRAFPVTVEAQQQVICAYDISIFMPDGTLFEPAAGEKINVSIQAPELYAGEASDATVYFIPEDEYSAPVPIDTSIQEDGTVCFETDHFSVYALMRSAALTEVYLNGTTGNDNNAGTQSSPVRTFEKALSMAAENGTIYVSGTVTVSNVESWTINVAGVKMQRASGFTGPLVTVANGGSLTLSNLTMNGGNGSLNPLLINNNSSYSTAYSANSAKAPLIVVNSGGALTITDDTVLKNNSNKPNTDANGAFAQSGYVGLGGAVYCGGTMTMTGGLIQNCEAQSGGGIYVENGSFRLSGGTIDNNYARNILAYGQTHATYRKNAGGGVYVGNNSSMVMSGGTVSNNQSSREGGGVSLGWLNRTHGGAIYSYTTEFTMTGGNFIGNEALSTGGGLNVTAGRKATVSAGYFTNNSAYGYDSQGDSYNGAYRVFSGAQAVSMKRFAAFYLRR